MPMLLVVGKWAAGALLPILAFFGVAWAITPSTDMTAAYVLLGLLAIIAIGIIILVWRS